MAPVLRLAAAAAVLVLLLPAHTAGNVFLTYPGGSTEQFESIAASFSASISKDGEYGSLRSVTPRDGCGPLQQGAPSNGTTFALIQHIDQDSGDVCEFVTKVKNAQAAGYGGVIVYASEGGNTLIEMGGSSKGIYVPAVFVTEDAGMTLINAPPDSVVRITADVIPAWSNFVITFIILLSSGVFLFTVFMFYRQRARVRQRTVLQLTHQEALSLPTRKFTDEEEHEICCICLADFEPGETLTVLPCKHFFHEPCILPWLTRRRRVCPICKRDPCANETTPLLTV